MSASAKRPLNQDERDAVEMLRGVTLPVASWDKRFVNNVLFPCLDSGEIGEKSAPQLWRIFIKYRRQTGRHHDTPERKSELLSIAEQLSAPDYRKQQKAAAEQRRYEEALKSKPEA